MSDGRMGKKPRQLREEVKALREATQLPFCCRGASAIASAARTARRLDNRDGSP